MPSTARPTLVWFRRDLRLQDNPALTAAAAAGGPVLSVYILGEEASDAPLGGAGRWWLDRSLSALDLSLRAAGSRLIIRRGPAETALTELALACGARQTMWNRLCEPDAVTRDARVEAALTRRDVLVRTFRPDLLNAPEAVLNGQGEPYRVFTAYWRAARGALRTEALLPAPRRLPAPEAWPASLATSATGLRPSVDWARGFRDWSPGEADAHARLDDFLEHGLGGYASGRDRLDDPDVSRLSPHLHWGEIGPRQVFAAVGAASHARMASERSAERFLAELGWRDFAAQLLAHFPQMARRNLRPAFDRMPWRTAPAELEAWRRGRTGYPVVDAAMRQLWATGWMPGRARMIVASFLTKHLLIHWGEGEAWFRETLVDADAASNAMNWQWAAGSGVDAQPFFRIFNPVTQGQAHDPQGDYVRRWVPELARLPSAAIHAPWQAPPAELSAAGVVLGETYPRPIVDHPAARARALEAFAGLRAG